MDRVDIAVLRDCWTQTQGIFISFVIEVLDLGIAVWLYIWSERLIEYACHCIGDVRSTTCRKG